MHISPPGTLTWPEHGTGNPAGLLPRLDMVSSNDTQAILQPITEELYFTGRPQNSV